MQTITLKRAFHFANVLDLSWLIQVSTDTYQYDNYRHVVLSQKKYLYLKLGDVKNKIKNVKVKCLEFSENYEKNNNMFFNPYILFNIL